MSRLSSTPDLATRIYPVGSSASALLAAARRLAASVLLLASVLAAHPSPSEATIQDVAYATSVGTVTGWNYEEQAIGDPSGKSCTAGAPNGSSQQPASYNPSINNTYWLTGTNFTSLAARTNMHIATVEVDANGGNATTTSGNINLDLGVAGSGVLSQTVQRIWSGSSSSCGWFSTRSNNPAWDVTANFTSLTLANVEAMDVRVRRHSASGSPGTNTYYDVLVRSFRVLVTWVFDAPNAPLNFRSYWCDAPKLRLLWNANPEDEPGRVCAYELSRSVDGGPFQLLVAASCAAPVLGASATFYDDFGVSPGHSYAYQLRALGEGGYSSVVSTPSRTIPGGGISWINSAGGDWNTPSNWDLGRVPTTCEIASITLPGTYTVTLNGSAKVLRLVLGGSSGTQTLSVIGGSLGVNQQDEGGLSMNPNGSLSLVNSDVHFGVCDACVCFCYGDGPGATVRGSTVMVGTSISGNLTNEGSLRMNGTCSISGNIVNAAGASWIVEGNACCGNAASSVGNQIFNRGLLTLTASGGAYGALVTAESFTNESAGTVVFSPGGTGVREIFANTYVDPFTAYGIRNAGTVTANAPGTLSRLLENSGSIVSAAPLSISNTGAGIGSVMNSGAISLTSGGGLSIAGSSLANTGTLSGVGSLSFQPSTGAIGLVNSGILSPGAAASTAGLLTGLGPYTQSGAGSLLANVGGPIAGVSFDQFHASGAATLGGVLNVSLLNGYVPPPGSSFHILRSTGRTGMFDTINLSGLPQGATMSVEYSDSGVVLQAGGTTAATPALVESRFHLDPPFPSPARGAVRLSLGLETPGPAVLEILDVRGRVVRRLLDSSFGSGSRIVVWDGRDDGGRNAVSGQYIACLSSGERRSSRSFVFLR